MLQFAWKQSLALSIAAQFSQADASMKKDSMRWPRDLPQP